MTKQNAFPFNRLLLFFVITFFAIGALYLFSSQVISRIPTIPPILFAVMTILLMVFHLLIAAFMLMKYLCDKHRLYLMAIACAFAGSAAMMLGTLGSYSGWLSCNTCGTIKYNDALIFYFFRNMLMAILFIASIVFYRWRHSNIHSMRNHVIILSSILGITFLMSLSAWLFSSYYSGMHVNIIDNITGQFTSHWRYFLISGTTALWFLTLIAMMIITRLRNIFWFSGYLFCVFYIFTLLFLLPADSIEGYSWYQSRLFETTATLFMILVLLCDVFTLYRDSNSKYQDSYQNSIRDPMTRLFNRSFFYESLKRHMALVSPTSPVSVIVCDLDHFKRINDSYGHLEGDKVIQFVANILQDSLSQDNIAARIGGEEFALLLNHTDAQNAWDIAEHIRKTICEKSQTQLPEQVTISMGVFTTTAPHETQETCVQHADEAMYLAKKSGRNRVVVWKA